MVILSQHVDEIVAQVIRAETKVNRRFNYISVWQVLNPAREKTLRDSSASIGPRCYIRDVVLGVTSPAVENDTKGWRQVFLDLFFQVDKS